MATQNDERRIFSYCFLNVSNYAFYLLIAMYRLQITWDRKETLKMGEKYAGRELWEDEKVKSERVRLSPSGLKSR